MYSISKSKYCKAVQCPKMLWLGNYMPEKAEPTASESVLSTGNEVGDLARHYFGDFSLVGYDPEKKKMCSDTAKLMSEGHDVIAEASFMYKNCFCSVDILRKTNSGYQLIEVKSSTELHDIYYHDMAYQYWVLKNCGITPESVWLMHINNSYVRHGDLDLRQLFTLEDCTGQILDMQADIESRVSLINDYMKQQDEPFKDIGTYCEKPYECEFKNYCHRNIPEFSVFNIHRLSAEKKYELYHKGIVSFSDIAEKKPKLSDKQYKQVMCQLEDRPPEINKKEIAAFLSTLSYPLYYLDFETYQQAIPLFDGVKPYMQIPFQYSLHVQHFAGGPTEHYEFLGKEGTDTRRALAESLCKDIPMNVCSLAFNMSFEKSVIKNLAELYSDLAEHLMNIYDNMHDLMVPFRSQHYYCKEMQGSYSIKWVLPALCGNDKELDYHALDGVHNGSEAMSAFQDLHRHSPEEIERIRHQLLAYCCLDTLAMVKVLEKLRLCTDDR